jgi:hypothetical protein
LTGDTVFAIVTVHTVKEQQQHTTEI